MRDHYLVYTIGFLGQAMFGARLIAQLILSERAGRVVSPSIFWIFSAIGSTIFLFYGVIRRDPVILLGQTISFYIYARNLYLKKVWETINRIWRPLILLIPPFMIALALLWPGEQLNTLLPEGEWSFILVIGAVGQLLLNYRYFYQLYYSEKASESLLPLGFWVISAAASIMVVAYAWIRHDPVLLVAQSAGLVVYLRNIWIFTRSKRIMSS